MNEKSTEWIIAIVFTIIGVLIIIFGAFSIFSYSKFKETAIETQAEVINVSKYTDSDGDTSYRIYVSYNVGNQVYTGSYSTTSYVFEGSFVKVYYDPNNPSDMREQSTQWAGILISILGAIFEIVGAGIIFNKINKNNNKNFLLQNGQKITAKFQEVIINNSYSVNGRYPYQIICQGRDMNGEIKVFKSENLWYNPEPIIQERNITEFPVYISNKNFKKYYLSLENIEQK